MKKLNTKRINKGAKMKRFIVLFVVVAFVAILVLAGCASVEKSANKIAGKTLDTAMAEVASETAGVIESATNKSYIVKKGDCLWNISKKQYKDPFLWWAIYKNNRDVIGENPDLIEVDEVLNIKKALANDEKNTCKQKAYQYGEK